MRVVELGRSDRRDYASTLSHIQAQDDTHAGTQTAITDGVTLTCDNDVINIIGHLGELWRSGRRTRT